LRPRSDNTKRFPALNAAGNRQCRECGKERKKGDPWISWCGGPCIDAYLVRSSPAEARKAVWNRDGGICAICKVNCARLENWLAQLPRHGRLDMPHGRRDRFVAGSFGSWLGRSGPRARTLLGRLWGVALGNRTTLWDADHVVPVAEGGGGCELSNLRTLCLRCHASETRALKARLAKRPDKGVGRGFQE
jgi:5-methylcytosine-specific restriction protein A